CVIVNSDGASTDGTPQIVQETKFDDMHAILVNHKILPVHKIVTPYHGLPGKGSALRSILQIGELLGARAMAVVDSDLRSITPEWVELLLGPIVREGFDYVAPLYSRHKFDGSITNTIVYPLFRALYSKRIRQPIGGEFGFSGDVARHLLSHDVWDTDVARYGIDIWMTTTAVTGGFKVCQSFLGAKIHDQKDPSTDLSSMLSQVVGSVFELMGHHGQSWMHANDSAHIPLFGLQYEVGLEPVAVNLERMLDAFRQGLRQLQAFWGLCLQQDNLEELKSTLQDSSVRFPDELWARLIFDFALAHNRPKVSREHLLKSLTPIYLGKLSSLFVELRDSGQGEVEDRIDKLCRAFELTKPYLIERWNK
ncbi:MAG: glycosyl transferase family 2, partial [Candidatus Eisenbacteria bacterium]